MTDQPLSPCRTMTKSAGLAPSCIIRAILVESDERFGQVVGLGHGAPPSVSAQRWCLRPRRSPHSFFCPLRDGTAHSPEPCSPDALLQWQEKGPYGKEHPAGQCRAHHPVPQRHRWLHDKRLAEPYPLPAGSRLLQDLGFMAFTLPQVEILMPRKKPPGAELSPAQQRANPLPPIADRACQQQCQALSPRQRPDPPVEAGRPGCRNGNLLCPA